MLSKKIQEILIFRESDRGAALVAASLLDKNLEDLARAYFRAVASPGKSLIDSLFAPMAPLSSFSAKIRICYLIGLIDEDQFHDLDLVRKLRNDFAHSSEKVDFTDAAISSKMRELIYSACIRDSIKRYSIIDKKKGTGAQLSDLELWAKGLIKESKALFAAAIQFLLADIQFTARQISKKGRVPILAINNTILRSPRAVGQEEAFRAALLRVMDFLDLKTYSVHQSTGGPVIKPAD